MKNLILLVLFSVVGLGSVSAQQIWNESHKRQLHEEYASALFRDKNAYMFVPSGDMMAMSSQTIFQYLQGRVPGLRIDNTQLWNPHISWRNSKTSFFLNEMRVDAATITQLSVNDIALVKVYRPPFVGAFGNGPGGAIAVYLMKGEEE